MKTLLVLSALLSLVIAKPTVFGIPTLSYETLIPSAPVGADGRVIDTPEVTAAKNQHAAAQLNERVNLANEASKTGEVEISIGSPQNLGQLLVTQSGSLARVLTTQDLATGSLSLGAPLTLTSVVSGTPTASIGVDGRVIDTPAVALAKAEHAAAHLNAQLNLSNEAARNSGIIAISTSPAITYHL